MLIKYNILAPVLGLLLGGSTAGAAQETDPKFSYGSDCAQLGNLSHAELLATLHPLHQEYFEHFCVARGVYSCSDYNGLLDGRGELEDNGVAGCRFVSSATR